MYRSIAGFATRSVLNQAQQPVQRPYLVRMCASVTSTEDVTPEGNKIPTYLGTNRQKHFRL